MKSANTLWMWNDDIPNNNIDEYMYVNRQDYSVWYNGQQIGYMKSDKSCIEPFYYKVYNNLKSSKKKIKRERKKLPLPQSYFYFFSVGYRK